MEFEVRNYTEIESFVVRWDYPIMVEAPELNAADLKQAKKGVNEQYSDQDFLHPLPVAELDEPLSYSKWMTAVMSATGMKSEDTFKKRRKKLVEAGKVVQVDGGYARPAPALDGKVPPAEPER